jgi:hypothetical protein
VAAGRDGAAALLPAGYRAWAALPELTALRAYAERAWLERCARDSIDLLLPVQALDAAGMKARWRECRHVLLL